MDIFTLNMVKFALLFYQVQCQYYFVSKIDQFAIIFIKFSKCEFVHEIVIVLNLILTSLKIWFCKKKKHQKLEIKDC